MQKSKIEWCDMTWNPVTGCLHGCEYCYARKIARRFGEKHSGYTSYPLDSEAHMICVDMPVLDKGGRTLPYPYGFNPTYHRYRLGDPAKVKKPQNIFVCSMADLFGEWVPDEWIQAVFEACGAAPWHRYLFLTKNPGRYMQLAADGKLPCAENQWYGSTITTPDDEYYYDRHGGGHRKRFLSIEPLHGPFEKYGKIWTDWVIIGAESGNRKDKIIPQREWIESIVNQCRAAGVPVFMKNSLADIWGEPPIQEYPW